MPESLFSSLIDTSSAISTDKLGNFVESKTGRRVHLRGINLDGASKMPTSPPDMTSYRSTKDGLFWDGDNISFVGRPFPLSEAETHFNRIKSWGFNTIRYIITWEAIEHLGPDKYDDEYINYTFKMLKLIEKIGGLYVFIDPHQDVWSRFTGGSGAPLWTLYAAGLNPHKFAVTEAAFIQNSYPDPAKFPKMVWPTNYTRLATFTMFTMFFSGKKFFPKCIINGVNIQDFLQSHFFNSIGHFMSRLQNEHPELMNRTIIGLETMNEPSLGLYGREDLTVLPKSQQLRINTSPTPFQAMKLGMGITCEVDTYEIKITGPAKTGSKLINEVGECCWIQDYKWDRHYKFERDEEWEIGLDVYALHGIWDVDTETMLKPDYFANDPRTGKPLNMDVFINENFMDYYVSFKKMLRLINKEIFAMMQVPVFEIPPDLIGSNIVDRRTILCQHYYDGMSLMYKTWNTKYNVDTLGILRGRYLNPVFGVVFGERNIRRCIRGQFHELNQEKNEHLGRAVPMMITETGMPFDMDDKKLYEDGDYSSQTAALDCIGYALESNCLSHTYWCYCAINCHKWGDRWNNEDFSFWSPSDVSDPFKDPGDQGNSNNSTLVGSRHAASKTSSKGLSDSEYTMTDASSLRDVEYKQSFHRDSEDSDKQTYGDGTRAADAIIRPYPVLINGIVKEAVFDLKGRNFVLTINTNTSVKKTASSVIYVPSHHFPKNDMQISVSTGRTNYKSNRFLQIIEWDYELNIGEIEMTIRLSEDLLETDSSDLKGCACGLQTSFDSQCSIQ